MHASDEAKRAVAIKALDVFKRFVKSKSLAGVTRPIYVGIGSGTTVNQFINMLPGNIEGIESCRFISSSLGTEIALSNQGLPVYALGKVKIDIYFDGADSVMPSEGIMIKGAGGALLKEKILFEASEYTVIMAESKKIDYLSETIPVEVHPFAMLRVSNVLNACIEVNSNSRPIMTDNGNVILKVPLWNKGALLDQHNHLICLAGVLDTGIFKYEKASIQIITERTEAQSE